jgi:hypothetical protein
VDKESRGRAKLWPNGPAASVDSDLNSAKTPLRPEAAVAGIFLELFIVAGAATRFN